MKEVKLSINGRVYDFPTNFTLGEARTIKRFTGMTLSGFEQADGTDPDVITVLVYIAMKREDPSVTEAIVEALDLKSISGGGGEEPTDEGPPPPAGAGEEHAAGDQSQETTPEPSGAQS